MELPNYSRQLMQQLRALRKEGQFCDCTILVGDSPHRAHKLVLAASSLLFRSILEGSDSVSIDTAVVSSSEFSCLLDMVYTGKLPPGKHNFTRIIAAADSLQMFDVAVGCKNILTSLMKQSTTAITTTTAASTSITTHTQIRLQGQGAEPTASPPEKASPGLGKDDVTTGAGVKREREKEEDGGGGGSEGGAEKEEEPREETAEEEEAEDGLPCKQARLQLPECTEESRGAKPQSSVPPAEKTGPPVPVEESVKPTLRLLQDMETEEGVAMDTGGLDAEEHEEDQPQSSSKSDDQRIDEEEGNEREEGEQNREEAAAGEGDGTQAGAKQSPSSPQPSSQPSSQPYSCRWCSKAFAYRCRLVAHDKSCSLNQEVKQQCPQCPEVLPTLRALQRHRAQAHPETARVKRKVACDLCGRTFAHPSGMLYHKRTEHFEEKPFACEECGAKFAANSSLKNHMRLHTGEKPYHCKHCAMSFSVAAALAYHTKKKHSEGKMYSCQYCEVVFAQSIELTRHVRTHTGDKPYVCRECGKGFSQANGLSVHLQTFHNITEPHDCHKCRLSFPSLEAHRQHVQDRHPREFHQCPLCQKTFSSAALLDKHKNSHSGRKPFSCQLCVKSYQQLSGLWYHNRTTHPEVFSQSQKQLKRLVQCSVCLRFFPSASSLDKHQRNQHRGEYQHQRNQHRGEYQRNQHQRNQHRGEYQRNQHQRNQHTGEYQHQRNQHRGEYQHQSTSTRGPSTRGPSTRGTSTGVSTSTRGTSTEVSTSTTGPSEHQHQRAQHQRAQHRGEYLHQRAQ